MISNRRLRAREMSAPGWIVAVREVARRAVLVCIVAKYCDRAGCSIEKLCGGFVIVVVAIRDVPGGVDDFAVGRWSCCDCDDRVSGLSTCSGADGCRTGCN